MSPIKAAGWVFKFVASLALMFGLTYWMFLAGVYGMATYRSRQEAKQHAKAVAEQEKRFEACLARVNAGAEENCAAGLDPGLTE